LIAVHEVVSNLAGCVWQFVGINSNGVWQPPSNPSPLDISAAAGVPVAKSAAVGSTISEDFDLLVHNRAMYYLGADQHIHQLYSDSSGGWHAQDLTTATSAPNTGIGSPVVSLSDTIANTTDVYFIGADQHVRQLWYSGSWHSNDLGAVAGAQNALAGSPLSVLINPKAHSVEVTYVAAGGTLFQLWYGGSWHANNLSTAAGAPAAGSGTPLAAVFDTIDNLDEIYYIGSDGHVHQMWFDTKWHTTDVSFTVGDGPAMPIGGLSAVVNTIASSLEVDYVGSDQHLRQLWYGSGIWHHNDLTALFGAPTAAAGTQLNSIIDPSVNHSEIYYLTSERHIYELWYNGDGNWYKTDISGQVVSECIADANCAQ
jgi:hypothetical protein